MTDDALREEHREYLLPPWQWRPLMRRVQDIPKPSKYILATAADRADADGTAVFPGIAALAVESGSTYEQVQDALRIARRLGLLFLARRGNKRAGKADEYWLVAHPELLDRATVESPEQQRLRAEQMRLDRRGRVNKSRTKVADETAFDGPTDRQNEAHLTVPQTVKNPDSANAFDGPTDRQMGLIDGPPDRQNGLFDGLGDPPTTKEERHLPAKINTPPDEIALSRPLTDRAHEAAPEETDFDEVEESAPPTDLTARPRCPHGRSPRIDDGRPRCADCRNAVAITIQGPARVTSSADCAEHPAMKGGNRGDGLPNCPLCRATVSPRRYDLVGARTNGTWTTPSTDGQPA